MCGEWWGPWCVGGSQQQQQRQGGLAWPAVKGQVHSGGGRGHQALGWGGGKTLSWWKKGKSVFQRNLISPALLGPLVVGLFMVQEQDQQWNFS